MWKEILWFEFRFQLRQPVFGLSVLLFFALAVGLGSSDVGTAVGDAPGTTLRNAPIAVLRLMPVISLLGLFVITAFVASAALRDAEHRSEALFFTKPIRKLDFLAGRFGGSMAASLAVLLVAVAGLVGANFAPWQLPDRLGPIAPAAYLFGVLVVLIPNLLVMGALFFALATWSRRLTVTFLCVVFFIGMQDAVEVLAQNLDSRVLGSLLEPSGIVALDTVTRYWTVAEQNSQLPQLFGVLLANRLIWLGVAGLVLAASWWRFDFTATGGRAKKGRKALDVGVPEPGGGQMKATRFAGRSLPRVQLDHAASSHWRQLLGQTRIEISEVLPRAPFLTLLAFGLLFVVAYAWQAGSFDGMPSLPLTHLMLGAIQLGARLTLVLILVLYAGELVFSQQKLDLAQVYDALPVPSWVFLGAKVLALTAIVGVFMLAGAASTITVQLLKGFGQLELGFYARGLMVVAWPMLPLLAMAVFFQVLTGRKMLGLLLAGGALIARFTLPRLGFENHLYLYGTHPALTWTDLNGYGHHAAPYFGFMAYWSACGLLLLLAAALLWPRGVETSIRSRLALARGRLSRSVAMVGILGLLITAGLGGWLFHQTRAEGGGGFDRRHVIQRLADYEQSYRSYRDAALPRVTSVFAEVDIFAAERQVEIRGRYRLENYSSQPIDTLPITLSPRWVEGVLRVYGGVHLLDLELPGHTLKVADPELGFYVANLSEPLLAGQGMDLEFTVRVDHRRLGNSRHNDLIVRNGTFFSNRNFLPVIGYARGNEVQDPLERKKHGLGELEQTASVDDLGARQRNYLNADWIDFETIVSTDAGQTAIAPGDLQRRWSHDGREFFHYQTEVPITHLIPFLSGEYEVRKERWNGIEIEVYFHPGHGFNIDRFVDVTQHSLEYLSESLGPYPHRQLRIVEVPRYHGQVAFSFAQTIAFSESWAFAADLERADLDWLTGILAHEIAHQWWNHQVVPGDVQGATLIAESLPQYAAMRILQRIYGDDAVRQFLKFHLDRYLERRGNERRREQPLALVDNQAYIHYSKASLALYSLADQVDESTVHQALRALIGEYGLEGPPYPTSSDLLAHLRAAVPTNQHRLLEDLFETITIFDNRLQRATYTERADGKFLVELETSSLKLRADGLGKETEVALDDWIDLGVFGERDVDGEITEIVLAMEKRHLRQVDGRFSFVVDQRPVRAGIDPYNKLIDRDSGDNVRTLNRVSQGTGGE